MILDFSFKNLQIKFIIELIGGNIWIKRVMLRKLLE